VVGNVRVCRLEHARGRRTDIAACAVTSHDERTIARRSSAHGGKLANAVAESVWNE